MDYGVHGGALAPTQILLPFTSAVFPAYAVADQYVKAMGEQP